MLARSVSAWYLFACLELGDLATVRVAAGMTVIYFKLLLELGYRGQGGGGGFSPAERITRLFRRPRRRGWAAAARWRATSWSGGAAAAPRGSAPAPGRSNLPTDVTWSTRSTVCECRETSTPPSKRTV